jgi:hypothetical protein
MVTTGSSDAAAAEIAAWRGGTIKLGAKPTYLTLQPTEPGDLAASLAEAGRRQFTLVVRGLAADSPPATGYLIFLNAPEGATLSEQDPGLAGSLSFFDVQPASKDTDAQVIAFEVSDVLMRLRAAGRLGGGVTVTLVPTSELAADSHPTINHIGLLAD